MYTLIFHKKADKEFVAAYNWYALQKPGLEERFRSAVDETLQKLKTNPQYFGYSKRPFREVLVKIFPYTIVYKIDDKNNAVYISAIYHTSRDPKKKYRIVRKR